MEQKNFHYSVMLQESIEGLQIKPDGIYIDCTLGRGGHSEVILQQLTTGHLYAFEQDQDAIDYCETKLAAYATNLTIIPSNFQNLVFELAMRNVFAVDGILFDLGVSSPQLDNDFRGFSYHQSGPLDMRMNQNQSLTAEKVVNEYTFAQLCRIFREYGEESFAPQIANAIIKQRTIAPIGTTDQLVTIIKGALPQKILRKQKHPARKVFQAIRIEVNDELNVLRSALEQAVQILKPQGRLVVITFHSLEDAIVKRYFQSLVTDPNAALNQKLPVAINFEPKYNIITRKPIVATDEELESNNRSRSAKLRILMKK